MVNASDGLQPYYSDCTQSAPHLVICGYIITHPILISSYIDIVCVWVGGGGGWNGGTLISDIDFLGGVIFDN